MTDQQLHYLRTELEQQKKAILVGIELYETAEEAEELEAVDNHPADQATDLADEYMDQALEEFREDDLVKVQNALSAIAKGTYGKCEVCGVEIPYERLEILPIALTCIQHAR